MNIILRLSIVISVVRCECKTQCNLGLILMGIIIVGIILFCLAIYKIDPQGFYELIRCGCFKSKPELLYNQEDLDMIQRNDLTDEQCIYIYEKVFNQYSYNQKMDINEFMKDINYEQLDHQVDQYDLQTFCRFIKQQMDHNVDIETYLNDLEYLDNHMEQELEMQEQLQNIRLGRKKY